MVLSSKTENQALRYILGICIIGISIYVFYILVSMRNSPELFLLPTDAVPQEGHCANITTDRLAACIPDGIDCSPRYGRLELYSAKNRIRGFIEVLDALPQEKAWRVSLHQPLIRAFIGDVDGMGTYELMDTILRHRYNPTLMGAKATLIPPWMKNTRDARILVSSRNAVLVFYTPVQSLGLAFREGALFMLSMKGSLPPAAVVGLMESVHLTKPRADAQQ